MSDRSTFDTLSTINVNNHTEKKNGLTYLSWAWAWSEVKKAFPDASYTVYENADGWNYHTDGLTAWVKTGVTINGLEHIEYLPVMDFKNKSIPAKQVTSFDVNKAIQRSLTKACARHGLGLYIYAGEDLPEQEAPKQEPQKPQTAPELKPEPVAIPKCSLCQKDIQAVKDRDGNTVLPVQVAERTKKKYGYPVCLECATLLSRGEANRGNQGQ